MNGSKAHRAFVTRRIFSLTGVVPLGAFVIVHVIATSSGIAGAEAAGGGVLAPIRTVWSTVFDVLFIYAPLAFHALYGIKVSAQARPSVARYPHSKNWMYTLQRVTGIAALGFMGYHLWQFRIQLALGNMTEADVFPRLCSSLSATQGGLPVVAILYLLGVAAVIFHLASGIWGFCVSWGFAASEGSQRVVGVLSGVFGVVLFAIAAHTIIYYATGSDLLSFGTSPRGGLTHCADVMATKVAAVGGGATP